MFRRATYRKAARINPDGVRRLAKFLGIRCWERASIRWVAHMCYQFTKKNRYTGWGMY